MGAGNSVSVALKRARPLTILVRRRTKIWISVSHGRWSEPKHPKATPGAPQHPRPPLCRVPSIWAWGGGFCSVAAGAPAGDFGKADNENLISVSHGRWSEPKHPTATPATPQHPRTPLCQVCSIWAWGGGFCSVAAGAPAGDFGKADNENLISVSHGRWSEPKHPTATPATPQHPRTPLCQVRSIWAWGGGFCTYYLVAENVSARRTHRVRPTSLRRPGFDALVFGMEGNETKKNRAN